MRVMRALRRARARGARPVPFSGRPVVLQRRAGDFLPIPDPPIDMSGGPGEPVVP